MLPRPDIKSSHLWNVQEPGDPYDIKKSMIARLPDHPTKPMGHHLELVCLLQAAQIERLSDYMAEIQIKYREVEKKELDRHSYQIQIKELADRNMNFSNLKAENDRLKDFIRRQTIELQQLQKLNRQTMDIEALRGKYESALKELQLSRGHTERSEQTISHLNLQINEWRAKCERIQHQKVSLRSQFDIQINERVGIEVRAVREQADDRISRLQVEVRQLKENLDNKNNQILILVTQRDQFTRQIRALQDKSRSQSNIETAIQDKNREVQRLDQIIEEKSYKLEQALASNHKMGSQIKILDDKYRLIYNEKESLLVRIREAEQQQLRNDALDKYEQRVAMMSMEIQRLNNLNITRTRQLNEINIQLEKLRTSHNQIQRQRDQLKRNQVDLTVMAANEQKISLLSQQLERVTIQLKYRSDQIHSLQQKIVISQGQSSQLSTINAQKGRIQQQLHAARTELRNYKTITDTQISSLRSQCGKLKHELDQQSGVNRSELDKCRVECDRLKNENQRIKNDGIANRRVLDEQKNNNFKLASQRNQLAQERNRLTDEKNRLAQDNRHTRTQLSQLRRYQNQFKLLVQQNKEKVQIIHNLQLQLDGRDSRAAQIELTMQNVYKQIDRLHSVLSTKTTQIMTLNKQLNKFEQKCRYLQNKLGTSSNDKQFYQQQIREIKKEIQALNRLKNQLALELQGKNQDISLVRSRYQGTLNQKEKVIAEHIKEKQILQRKYVELQRDLAQRVPFQEQVSKDFERSVEDLRNKDVLISRLQTTIRELEKRFEEAEGKVVRWQSKVIEWQTRLKDAERVMHLKDQDKERLTQQINRLSSQLGNSRLRREDETKYKDKMDSLTQQNLRLRMRIDDFQRNKNSNEDNIKLHLRRAQEALSLERKEAQNFRGVVSRLQGEIVHRDKQLQMIKSTVKEYQLKIVHIESTHTKIFQQKLKHQQLKLQQRDSLIITLQRQIKTLENRFSHYVDQDRSKLTNLSQYQNKISLLSTEFQRLNRVVQDQTQQIMDKDRTIQQLKHQLNSLTMQLNKKVDTLQSLRRQLSQKPTQSHVDNSQQYQIQITNLKNALQQLESINLHAIAERDELFKVSHQLKAQFDSNLAKMTEEEKKLRRELQYRLDQNRALGEELGELRKKEQTFVMQVNQLKQSRQEDPHLKKRVNQLQQTNSTQFNQLSDLKIENTNLRTEVNQIENMLQQLRAREANFRDEVKIGEYEQLLSGKEEDLVEWENKYTSLYAAYQQLYSNYNLTKTEYQVTMNNVKVYETKIFTLEEDFSALSGALTRTRAELQDQHRQNHEFKLKRQGDSDLYQKNILLSKEIDRLNQVGERMKQDLSDTRIRLTDSNSLQKRIQQNLGLFVVLFAEIESLRSRVTKTEHECEQVRRTSLVPLRVDRSPGRHS